MPPTPAQTEGPFYPDHLPLDTDNDLLAINENLTPAVGEVTYVSGRILDAKGQPVKQYEPYFTSTSGWEPEAGFEGVTPILHYDPLEIGRAHV